MKAQKGNKIDFQLLWRVLIQARPYKLLFFASGFLAVILAPVSILRPYLIQYTVDNHVLQYDIEGLQRMVMILVAVLILNALLRYSFIYATNWLGQSVIRDLRVRVFRHLTSLKLQYFDKTPIGQSTTRTINDIETLNSVFSQGVITMIADILTLAAVLGVMFYTSWELTLICLTTLPLLLVATYIFKEKVKVSFQKVRTQISVMNSFLQERISGMRIVQIFNAEKKEFDKFDTINKSYTKANVSAIFYYAVFFPVVEILSAVSLALMVWWGARGVITDSVSLGVLIAFPLYLGMLFRPVRMLADKFNTLQMGLVAAERVFKVLDSSAYIQDNGSYAPESIEGEIRFQNVHFTYDGVTPILKDISFEVNPGETLAIVGSTGSGKTTIINILNRFYEIKSGHIFIDGVKIQDYSLDTLRQHLAMVLQDVFLFSGTVLENITLRDNRFSRDEVIAAAKLIGADQFIEKLPGGYDYQVMERGAALSMGQRQLISFVRALIFDPNLLILDEATSSIDPETESIIQHAIETLISKRTSIIIAHRLTTIRHADKILVLDKGRVAEFGTPAELLKIEGGHYKHLFEMQYAGAIS